MIDPSAHLTDEDHFALLDARLEPEEERAAQAHLAGCADCRAKAGTFHTLFADLAALPDLPAPHRLTRPVMAAIRGQSTRTAPRRLPAPVRLWAAFQLGAALVILLLLSRDLEEWAQFALTLAFARDLAGFAASFARLSALAAGWAEAAGSWVERLPIPSLPPIRFDADALLPTLAALLPLIAASGLLWLVGNALLLRTQTSPQENDR